MLSARDRLAIADIATVIAVGAVAKWGWDAISLAETWHPDMMSDGLPLHLGALTLRAGGDPTDAAALAATYAAAGMRAQAHMFSTLYPASTAALLEPVMPDTWEAFASAWRIVLLGAAAVAGAAGAASGVPFRRALLAGALGAVVTTICLPTALTCARLGQINQLLAGLAGLAQLAASAGLPSVGAAFLVLGGGLKLVPVLGGWPYFTGLRWRSIGVALLTGLGVLVATGVRMPLGRAVEGVLHTLRFESGTSGMVVAGLSPADPRWWTVLVEARHHPLALLTVGLAGYAGWVGRASNTDVEGRQALVGGVALVFAWLAADAAAQHELYLPLTLASLGWAVTWPLAAAAPRRALFVSALTLIAVLSLHVGALPRAFHSVLVGEAIWLAVAVRVWWECRPASARARRALAAGVVLALLLAARPLLFSEPHGPRPPGHAPVGEEAERPPAGHDVEQQRHTPRLPPAAR